MHRKKEDIPLNRSRSVCRRGPVSARRRAGFSPDTGVGLFCELLASAGVPPGGEASVRRRLRTVPGLVSWIFEKRFPAAPFLANIGAGSLFHGMSRSCFVVKRRWRLLRRFVLANAGRDEAGRGLETATSDLWFVKPAPGHLRRVESSWRIHGRAVLSKSAPVPEKSVQPLSRLYWGGAGGRKTAFWEKLILAQARELTGVRRLATEVSKRAGRVVLSWHNASAAAAGGWAFEEPAFRFDSPGLYGRFIREVRDEAARIRKSFDSSSAIQLFDLRADRIFSRKMARAIEDGRICSNFAGRAPADKDARVLPGDVFDGAGIGESTEWPGALSPHQKISPGQLRSWIDNANDRWTDGLILLFAFAVQGQRMIDSGVIDSLVLPWIDKFFISSMRAADAIYLERLLRFVSSNIERPLILFWEDTSRRKSPSLGIALEDLAGRGLPVRGIGVFGERADVQGKLERAGALRIILDEYRDKTLFALRPLDDNHCPDAFRRVFKELDMKFVLNYDSSWKDNLAFIYTGTQVFPLLSVQTEMECVAPWVCAGRERYAFGEWFRRILRRISLGGLDGISCPVWLECGSRANLL
jgi:hypothetical protein